MPENCTILCPADKPKQFVALVRKTVGDRGRVSVKGKLEDWFSITIKSKGASLVLNRRIFRQNADEFSKMLSGMWWYFDSVKTHHKAIKADVLRRVEEHVVAVGVVAEPEFVAEAGHNEWVFALARALDAMIWNGDGALDSEGRLMLDGEGKSEFWHVQAEQIAAPDSPRDRRSRGL